MLSSVLQRAGKLHRKENNDGLVLEPPRTYREYRPPRRAGAGGLKKPLDAYVDWK